MRYVHEKLERIWLPGSQVVQFGVSCFQPFSINLSTYDVFISLDDKFWHLQGASSPFACVKGIFRFKTSTKVTEFWDLRANPRRLFEGQIFFFRVKWSSDFHDIVLLILVIFLFLWGSLSLSPNTKLWVQVSMLCPLLTTPICSGTSSILKMGFTFSLEDELNFNLNKISTSAEDFLVWSDLNRSGKKWLIEQRTCRVNEYTYVHCYSVVYICLRSLNIFSITGIEGRKGWTLRDKVVGS